MQLTVQLDYNFVGVKVTTRAELEAVYDTFVALGYSESHSRDVDNMFRFLEYAISVGEVFGLCIDNHRDILGVFDFDKDAPLSTIARCTLDNLEVMAKTVFPLLK